MADLMDDCGDDGDDEVAKETGPSLAQRSESLQEIISADIDQVFDEASVQQAAPAIYAVAVKLMAEYMAYMQLHGMPENIERLTRVAIISGYRVATAAMGISVRHDLHAKCEMLAAGLAEEMSAAAMANAMAGR